MFHLFVLFSIILVIITATFYSFELKNRLEHSYGMMISMFFGTNIGLTIGVLFGSIYQGSLYKSTLISVSLGFLLVLYAD